MNPMFTHCLAVVKVGNEYLLGQNKYFSKKERIELGGLYGIALPDMSIDEIYAYVKDKAEITGLAWYSHVKGKEPIAAIDEALLEYYI